MEKQRFIFKLQFNEQVLHIILSVFINTLTMYKGENVTENSVTTYENVTWCMYKIVILWQFLGKTKLAFEFTSIIISTKGNFDQN